MPRNTDMFPPTRWSQISAAGSDVTIIRQRALGDLYRAYSQAVYCCIRRRGYDHHKAEDLTQGYFLHLIAGSVAGKADPTRGKFRAFIQHDLGLFLKNAWRHDNCPSRGGGAEMLSLDALKAEHDYDVAAGEDLEPAKLLDREWAKATLKETRAVTLRSYTSPERVAIFDALSPLLDQPATTGRYTAIAGQLQIREEILRVEMTRLRKHFRKALYEVVAETLEHPTPDDISEEIRYLFSLLALER